jgi:hypothetical protein
MAGGVSSDTSRAAPRFGLPTILLVAANALPLVGILLWGWDAFEILILYWCETAIIGFWTLVRLFALMVAPENSASTGWRRLLAPTAVSIFFILHSGIFMLVHFMFLWALFAGDWANKISGPQSFFSKLFVGAGLWVPLLALFVVRGLFTLYEMYRERNTPPRRPGAPQAETPNTGSAIGGFYRRIIIMHFAIIAGGFLAMLGSIVPLIALVVIKTVIDVRLSREG